MRRSSRRRVIGLVWVAVWLGGAAATTAEDLDREMAFASGLVEMGFPDFAERLLGRLTARHPDMADRAKTVQVEILVSRRRFQEAERLAAGLPDGQAATDAIRLAIANGYYRVGEIDRARALYQAFFERYRDGVPEDADVRRFFLDAAYRFGQMLEQAGELGAAISAFERVLEADPPERVKRRMQYELAALVVRAARRASGGERRELLQKARALCETIQWGAMDLWFGRSIITLAHIELVEGRPGAAANTIRGNLDIFNQIEDMLKDQNMETAHSPLAGARFLLGEISRDLGTAAEQAGDTDKAVEHYSEALRQFFNVFARYTESAWGADAGVEAEQVRARLEGLGRTVRVDLGAHAARVAAARLRMADELFVQRNYAGAAPAYREILSRFPRTDQSARALSNLLMSYVRLGLDLEMRAVAEHIAERYAANPDAGLALLVAGKHFFDEGAPEAYRYFYDLFLRGFPKHPRAPAIAFTLAGLLGREGDAEGQDKYLELLVREYKGDAYYFRALQTRAWNLYGAQDFEAAADLFREVIGQSPPSHERARAQFTLADSLVRLGRHADAVREFQTLQEWLEPRENNPYGTTAEEEQKNRELIESAAFFTGLSLSRIEAEPDQLPRLREAAVQRLEAFVADYPDSGLASRAMSVIGGVRIELGQAEQAAATFDELARRYPDSEEGRNARFSLIRAAVEIGKIDIAREAFNAMMAERAKYPLDQVVRVAQWMLDSELYEEAFAGFETVMASDPSERAVRERALYGLGRAAYETGRFDVATQRLGELLDAFPLSGLFFDAQFTLGRAHREAGRLEAAVDALRDVFQRATDPVLANIANMELAQAQGRLAQQAARAENRAEERTQLRAALASYQRVAMFGDPEHPEIRPMVRNALLESLRLFMALERYDDAVETCDQFLRDFPDSPEVAAVRRQRAEANLRAGTRAPGG